MGYWKKNIDDVCYKYWAFAEGGNDLYKMDFDENGVFIKATGRPSDLTEAEVAEIATEIQESVFLNECAEPVAKYFTRIGGRPTRPNS